MLTSVKALQVEELAEISSSRLKARQVARHLSSMLKAARIGSLQPMHELAPLGKLWQRLELSMPTAKASSQLTGVWWS